MEKQISKLEKPFEIKRYCASQLAELYGVSLYVIRKWLKAISKELGPKRGWYYSPRQVKIVIENYGVPGRIIVDKE